MLVRKEEERMERQIWQGKERVIGIDEKLKYWKKREVSRRLEIQVCRKGHIKERKRFTDTDTVRG